MKDSYVVDLAKLPLGTAITLFGWIQSKRTHGKLIFIDVIDSTGEMQAVIDSSSVEPGVFILASGISCESSVKIQGFLENNNRDNHREIRVTDIEIIASAKQIFSPQPRSHIDVFDPRLTDHLLKKRHAYIWNPKIMAILRLRSELMAEVRQWFRAERYIEITAPILTRLSLYDEDTAITVNTHDGLAYLTQCAGYYLEATTLAYEKVYNVGPSFRREESRSKRHLMEYWHIKAEVGWANLDDIIR